MLRHCRNDGYQRERSAGELRLKVGRRYRALRGRATRPIAKAARATASRFIWRLIMSSDLYQRTRRAGRIRALPIIGTPHPSFHSGSTANVVSARLMSNERCDGSCRLMDCTSVLVVMLRIGMAADGWAATIRL